MKRILVVDDKEVHRSLLQALLERDGYQVDPARDGREALAWAALRPPDLVISDLLMPAMDGYALLRHWKADERLRVIPFVICTGTYTDREDEKLARDLGADGYLRKPAEPAELAECVSRLLALPAAGRPVARAPIPDDGEQLQGYSRALVRKLEAKTGRLERANQELADANGRLRQLSQRVLEVQEEERATIARELHDEIGQALTAIKLGAQSLVARVQGADARRLADCIAAAEGALGQVRSLALELRPPQLDHLGLAGALRGLTERMAHSAAIDARFVEEGRDVEAPADIAITAYRLVQEALTNVVRHSGAKHATVELACKDGELRIAVSDDGRGFDVDAARSRGLQGRSLGLVGMQERAALAGGWLRFESRPGQGTRVEAGFPPRARGCAA
jgi:signal transduction histidine kinase